LSPEVAESIAEFSLSEGFGILRMDDRSQQFGHGANLASVEAAVWVNGSRVVASVHHAITLYEAGV